MKAHVHKKVELKPIVVIQSKNCTITVTSKGSRYKLFKIFFGAKGDVYINFPYYKENNGIVGQAFLKPQAESITLDPDCAKITSHLVKFAYHPDGETHFSQDGKVKTEIRKKSLPLDKLDGHIFTVSLQNIEKFDEANSPKYNDNFSKKKSVINFNLGDIDFEALKFVGIWNPFTSLIKNISHPIPPNVIGPQFTYKGRKGEQSVGFLIGPEPGNPFNGYVLSLRLSLIPKLNKETETALTFMGGFDCNIETSDPSKDYSFLIFMYPHIKKTGEGTVTFESIDLSLD